jgi:class 3 adenylate cyclase
VIWYCDLRGFTRASDSLPRDAIIALLNDYFDTMGALVTSAGGEILKFMGDGMLAIFPVGSAVNHAARLEKLCSPLDRSVVLSASLAELLPKNEIEALGRHAMKDIDAPQSIYGLR